MSDAVIYSFVAGIIGTGVGGFLGVIFSNKGAGIISKVIALAGGVMLAVVFFDLIPEAMLLSVDPMIVLIGLVWGIVVMAFLNCIVDRCNKRVDVRVSSYLQIKLQGSESKISIKEQKGLKRAGLFLMLAIALHDIPEGLAIGASSAVDGNLGLAMAIVICLHNVPEGMAISLPLAVGRVGRIRSVLLSILAGSMTIVGGLVGGLLGNISTMWTGFFLAFAGGAMIQVTLCEMLQDSIKSYNSSNICYYIIIGIILGFVVNVLL